MSDTVKFGADAEEYFSVIGRMQSKLDELAARGGRGLDGLTGAHDRLFTSSHRVANRIGGLAQTLIQGGDAASTFGVAIESVGRSLNLSLGSLAAAAAIGVLFVKLGEGYEKSKKLREELKGLLADSSRNADFSTFDQLEKKLEGIRAKLAEIEQHRKTFAGGITHFPEYTYDPNHPGIPTGVKDDSGAPEARTEEENIRRAQAAELAFQNQLKERKNAEFGKALTPDTFQTERDRVIHDNIRKLHDTAAEAHGTADSGAFGVMTQQYRERLALIIEINQKEQEQIEKHDLQGRAMQHANDLLEIEKRGLSVEDEAVKKLKSEVSYRENLVGLTKTFEDRAKAILDLEKSRLEVTKKQKDVAAEATKEAEKYAQAAKDAQNTTTPGQRASERRTERAENRREKDLKNELSREGDPEKRANIQDELTEIQQAREDRALKAQQQEAARQAAEQAAAQAQAKAQAEAQKVAQQKAAEEGRVSDEKELNKYGRILSPEERLSENIKDQETAPQQAFQDQEAARQQSGADQNEAGARGISVEQLQRERQFKKGQGVKSDPTTAGADSLGGKDFSSLASLGGADFSGLASLNTAEFRSLLALDGLNITIA